MNHSPRPRRVRRPYREPTFWDALARFIGLLFRGRWF